MSTITVSTEMTFDDLMKRVWGGAVRTLSDVKKAGKENELMDLLAYWAGDDETSMTDLNDFLWFDDDYIYDYLGIAESEEEE